MRQVISISLPKDKIAYIKQKIKQGGFASKSAYFRHLLDLEASLISEDDVLNMADIAKKAHRSGKTKRLNSLADLI